MRDVALLRRFDMFELMYETDKCEPICMHAAQMRPLRRSSGAD